MNPKKRNKKYPPLPIILILIVSIPFLWFVYDRLNLILNSDYQSAKIVTCDYKWQKSMRTKSGGGRVSTIYKPVAISKSGITVKGNLQWRSRDWCERRVGKTVGVFIHNKKPSKNSINSFFQLWLHPYISAVFFILFLVCCRFNNSKVTPSIAVILASIPIVFVVMEFLI